jgi:hypothetical protein
MTTINYANELKRVEDDNTAFDALIAKLRADRTVRQRDMRDIAVAYLGWEMAKSRPRTKALQQIIDWQALGARQKARMGQIDKHMQAW